MITYNTLAVGLNVKWVASDPLTIKFSVRDFTSDMGDDTLVTIIRYTEERGLESYQVRLLELELYV